MTGDRSALSDGEVARRVVDGDKDSFGLLIERYQKPIFNFIYRFYGNYDLAEELTQETFLRCYNFLKSYDTKRKFSTWLYTVARNLCIDHLKKHRAGRSVSLDQALPVIERYESGRSRAEESPQFLCIRSEEDTKLLRALSRLEPSRRIVLILYYFQGLSYQEIGEALSLPVSTVKIRIFRAKKALLELMSEGGGDGP